MNIKFKGTATELKNFLAGIDENIKNSNQSIKETNEFLARVVEEDTQEKLSIMRECEIEDELYENAVK